MNRQSIINKITVNSPFGREKGSIIFNRIFELLKQKIINEKEFDIENFCSFKIIHRKMKRIIDHKKRCEILLPPKNKINLSISENIKKKLNK